MTLRFIGKTGQSMQPPIDFGPYTLVVVPQVGDFVELNDGRMIKVVERRYKYDSPTADTTADPQPVVTLILAWA